VHAFSPSCRRQQVVGCHVAIDNPDYTGSTPLMIRAAAKTLPVRQHCGWLCQCDDAKGGRVSLQFIISQHTVGLAV